MTINEIMAEGQRRDPDNPTWTLLAWALAESLNLQDDPTITGFRCWFDETTGNLMVSVDREGIAGGTLSQVADEP